jgi:hypothetical protein
MSKITVDRNQLPSRYLPPKNKASYILSFCFHPYVSGKTKTRAEDQRAELSRLFHLNEVKIYSRIPHCSKKD